MLGRKIQYLDKAEEDVNLYIPEFSKPTGKYVSRLLLRLLNFTLRKGSIVFAGNPCTPGMSVLTTDKTDNSRSLLNRKKIRTLVCNFWGIPETDDGIVFKAEPFMLLQLKPEWSDLADYKQAMHSKYRVRINKALNCSIHLQSVWVPGNELAEEDISEMANLLADTLVKKTLALPPDLQGLIRGFCREYASDYQTVFCRDEHGQIMGFLSAVIQGDTAFAMHIGYRPQHAREWHLYQRLMLDLIDRCILSGKKAIQLGRTATEIKSTLGAEPLENSIVVFTKSKSLRLILHIYRRYFFKPKSYVVRQPFRLN